MKTERETPKYTRRQRRLIQRAVARSRRVKVIPAGFASSQCRCGDAFGGRTTREAIAARKFHEADAHR